MRLSRRNRQERRESERADQISWGLLIFGLVRMVAWIVMMVFVGLGLLGVDTFKWASHLGTLVVFVTLISFYANAATDLDAVTAAWAAIRAGKAHAQGLRNEASGAEGHAETLVRIEALAELIHDHQMRGEQ